MHATIKINNATGCAHASIKSSVRPESAQVEAFKSRRIDRLARGYHLGMSSFRDFNSNLIQDLRAHGGKATGGPFMGHDVLILTTKGARSGKPRENPLAFSRDDHGNYVIVASKGGAPTHPSWYHNLLANPNVTVEALGEKFAAQAHVVGDEDYERLYQNHARKMPGFNEYRKRTTRKIPVIALERLDKSKVA